MDYFPHTPDFDAPIDPEDQGGPATDALGPLSQYTEGELRTLAWLGWLFSAAGRGAFYRDGYESVPEGGWDLPETASAV